MNVAAVLQPVVIAALGSELPVRVDCWDGSSLGPPDAVVAVRFASRRALRDLIWSPNELGFARAYVSGDIQIEGDLLDTLNRLDTLARVATALDRHLVVSFPETVPSNLIDAVQVA